MRIAILTIFPEIFSGFLSSSILSKAIQKNQLNIELFNIRDFAAPPHYQVDDTPYGGGAGMVMRPEPIAAAIEAAKTKLPAAKVILMCASGRLFNQNTAEQLSRLNEVIIICGRYEGIDQRIIDALVDHEISIGDYVLMGGEVAAMTVIEACVRLIPEVLGNKDSLGEESFNSADEKGMLLEGPQYTRPAEFMGMKVPDILLSGDHKKIGDWRKEQSLSRRAQNRPDLIKNEPKS